MSKISILIILNILVAQLSAKPVEIDDRIVFIEDDDERFNDIIDPAAILGDIIDNSSFKKFLNDSVNPISRFDDSDIDDDAEDFVMDVNIPSDELVESQNKSVEFFDDNRIKSRLQNGQRFQGDIMIPKHQGSALFGSKSDDLFPTRTGIIDFNYRWRMLNGAVLVPYKFWKGSKYSNKQKTMIRLAMNDIEQQTCVRFIARSREIDFVLIYSGDDCSSFLGRAGGQQLLSLRQDGCFSRGIIIHELIHTLGYDHMQNHPQRDNFVKIFWENIKPESRFNFNKLDPNIFSNFGTRYDYYSIMHYDPLAFSMNGRRTVVPINDEYRNVIGQRVALSKGDIARINIMYGC